VREVAGAIAEFFAEKVDQKAAAYTLASQR